MTAPKAVTKESVSASEVIPKARLASGGSTVRSTPMVMPTSRVVTQSRVNWNQLAPSPKRSSR